MVINMTLGFVKPARGSGLAGPGLVGIACAKIATPRTGMTTIKKKVNKKAEKRPAIASIAAPVAARAASPRLPPP